MAKVSVIFGILILQCYVYAAPSDISKIEDIATIEDAEPKLDDEPIVIDENEDSETPQTVRQKRFYNYYGYGFPPINPIIYSNHGKRDESIDTSVYGANDPLERIHQRLQEISSLIKQPHPPQPPVHLPIYFPVLFVPQACNCNTPTGNEMPSQEPPTNNDNTRQEIPTSTESNQTNPNVTVRVDIDEDYETEYEDNNRPISFDPIVLNKNLTRPPPPVEHGSNQASAADSNPSTNAPVEPSPERNDPLNNANPAAAQPLPQAPSICDGAVLSCCHQLQITYDCFALQGCPDPTSYGNPCDVNVILSVIYKFQNYYAQRNG